nr:ribonuclease H-like domain-containing protein [Tanacetum cinerariifolium]
MTGSDNTLLPTPLSEKLSLVTHNRLLTRSAKEARSLISDIVKDNKRSRTNTLKADLDAHVNEEDVVHYALEGLSDTYNQVCSYMHWKDTFPDLKVVRSLLIAEVMRLKSKVLALPADSSSPMVLVAKTSTNSRSSTSQGTSLGLNSTPPPGFPSLAQAHVLYYGYTTASTPVHLTSLVAGLVYTTIGSVLSSGAVNTSGQATLLPQAFTAGTLHDPTVVVKMWHQRLGHPESEVLRRLVSNNVISCNKEKPPVLCHAYQLGKHVRLSFVSSSTIVSSCFEMVHSDQNAMWDKYDALIKNSTWTLVPRPPDVNVVHCIWLFRHKFLADSTQSRYKARLVANGSTQLEGVDVDKIFSPVVKPGTILELGVVASWFVFGMAILVQLDQVCLHMHDPREPHLSAFKRILRYVQGTLNYGLRYFLYLPHIWLLILMQIGLGVPLLEDQLSEAEYRGVANVVAETCWLHNLLRELHNPLSSATLVYCDNVNAVYLSCNLVQHQRTKHIEIDIHFVLDLVAAGQVRVLHVPYHYQFADIFTKGLPSALFEEFRTSLSIRCPPALTAGEC